MSVMKENFLINAHDTTFSPTGLYNFVKDSELVDSSGNSKTLTQNDAATEEANYINGEAEGLAHFDYYRNSNTDFKYTGAMSFCCLFRVRANEPDSSTSNQHYFVAFDGAGAAGPSMYALLITKLNSTLPYEIVYSHESSQGTYHSIGSDTTVPNNHEWHHLAFTRDSNGTGIKVYLDGTEIVSGTTAKAPGEDAAQNSGYFSLGTIYNLSSRLNSTVVQTSCAIYNQQLSANQIKYLARKTLGYHRVQ